VSALLHVITCVTSRSVGAAKCWAASGSNHRNAFYSSIVLQDRPLAAGSLDSKRPSAPCGQNSAAIPCCHCSTPYRKRAPPLNDPVVRADVLRAKVRVAKVGRDGDCLTVPMGQGSHAHVTAHRSGRSMGSVCLVATRHGGEPRAQIESTVRTARSRWLATQLNWSPAPRANWQRRSARRTPTSAAAGVNGRPRAGSKP